MKPALLEICAFNIQSCLIAEASGAHRIELCDNPHEGGTTPSYGLLKKVRQLVQLPVYPIIRPRAMNYWYDSYEWEIMLDDIRICKSLGMDGISIGAQLKNGCIDTARMRQVADLAYPMGVTCNRVIDAVPDALEALEQLIDAGCERILTSGQAATAPEGCDLLQQLVDQAANRIIIMPGAGVRASNIRELKTKTGAEEFHTSARKPVPNEVAVQNSAVSDAGQLVIADEAEINAILKELNDAGQ